MITSISWIWRPEPKRGKQIEEISGYERAEYSEVKKRFVEKGYDIDTETGKLETLLMG